MQQRLTDTERTLLSAYIDGELSAEERRSAEALLAHSPVAQAYVTDLQVLNNLSIAAFPTAGISTAAGATVAGKLTSSAIKAAAEKSVVAKGLLTGGWGLAGMTTAAVAVVAAGVMLVTPSSDPVITRPDSQPHAIEAPAHNPITSQVVNTLDTTSVMVPEMTPDDLINFAVNGTLPIDEGRERFIKVADTASVVPVQHVGLPAMLNREMGSFDPGRMREIDSIQKEVRTSLIACSGNRTAIRSDISTLRLQVLRWMEDDLAPRLSVVSRQQLSEIRQAVEVEAKEAEQQARIYEKRAQEIEAGVRYVVLPEQSFQSASAGTPVCIPPRFFNREDNTKVTQVVFVQNNSLEGLRRQLQSMPATVTTVSVGEQRVTAGAGAGASAGVNVSRTVRTAPSMMNPPIPPTPIMGQDQEFMELNDGLRSMRIDRHGNASVSLQNTEEGQPVQQGRRQSSVNIDPKSSLDEHDIERMLNGVQQKLDRVDSILRSVNTKVKKKDNPQVKEDGDDKATP